MKKEGAIVLIVLVIILIILITGLNYKKTIPEQEILSISKTQVDFFCEDLENKYIDSSCPTCSISLDKHIVVDKFSENPNHNAEYVISKISEGYEVNIRIHTIYGRNTRPGKADIKLIISNEGIVTNKTFPEATCFN